MSIEARIQASSGRRQATAALMIATAMQALDTTIANVALPQLEQSLGGGIELGSWVMTSYLCASAIMATLTGWLRRRYGTRPLFIGSLSLFIVASGLCSIAPSSVALIQFRLVQGAAAGIIQPLAQAILLDIYPQRDHGRMLAIWGATIMAGPILGPVLGGVIADLSSWRWIFVLNVPLGLIAIMGLGQVPSTIEPTTKARIDGVGLVLLIIGVGSLQLALQRMIGQTWPFSIETAAEAAVAVFALAGIAIRSLRWQFTLFRFQVFRSLNFSAAVFYNFLIGALLFTPDRQGRSPGIARDRNHRHLGGSHADVASPTRWGRTLVGRSERNPRNWCRPPFHPSEHARLFQPWRGTAHRCGRRLQPVAATGLRNRRCRDDSSAAGKNSWQFLVGV
ncbi:MAG: DHA2 family efflux MFS transporter permease subunit [Alphaproteobacteria bacterium]|nr:MAG: DHA2 family efflux MFS transporter permease subunit [Alphaproteobacteria bacterium]